jgi:hypothetical protein
VKLARKTVFLPTLPLILFQFPNDIRTFFSESLPVEIFDKFGQRSLPLLLLVICKAPEFFGIHPKFPRHLNMYVGKTILFLGGYPFLVLIAQMISPIMRTGMALTSRFLGRVVSLVGASHFPSPIQQLTCVEGRPRNFPLEARSLCPCSVNFHQGSATPLSRKCCADIRT